MESFLDAFGHKSITFHLKANGINDANFYLEEAKVKSLLKDYERFDDFVQDYDIQRCQIIDTNVPTEIDTSEQLSESSVNLNTETIDDFHVTNSDTFNEMNDLDSSFHTDVENPQKKIIPRGDFDKYFVNNDLFFLLNSTLEGQVILGRYLNSNYIDLASIKRIMLFNEFKEGSTELKLEKKDFERLSTQCCQLFKELDEDSLYSPYVKDKELGIETGSKGVFYQEYKDVRRYLREAGICVHVPNQSIKNKRKKKLIQERYTILNDPNQDKYEFSEIILLWDSTRETRLNQLLPPIKSKLEKISLKDYFKSLPCLRPPIATLELLKLDFKYLMKVLPDTKKLSIKDLQFYSDAFSKNWPREAKKIIQFVLKSNKPSLKALRTKYPTIFSPDGKDICTAALLAINYCINVTKPIYSNKENNVVDLDENVVNNFQTGVKRSRPTEDLSEIEGVDDQKSKSFSKDIILKSFILNVQKSSSIDIEKRKFEKIIDDNNLEHHPYVIAYGDWTDLTQFYLVINKEQYRCETLTECVEKCFQCLIALRRWPYLCDHLWYFIMKRIYLLKPPKSVQTVNDLCTKLNSIQ